jgi:hypothetical protein
MYQSSSFDLVNLPDTYFYPLVFQNDEPIQGSDHRALHELWRALPAGVDHLVLYHLAIDLVSSI